MRITYYALRRIQVGDDWREPGDLVPEAADWPFLPGYVNDGQLAPVLVATLPEEQQVMLLEWEEATATEAAPEVTEEPDDEPVPGDEPGDQPDEPGLPDEPEPESKTRKSKTREKVA